MRQTSATLTLRGSSQVIPTELGMVYTMSFSGPKSNRLQLVLSGIDSSFRLATREYVCAGTLCAYTPGTSANLASCFAPMRRLGLSAGERHRLFCRRVTCDRRHVKSSQLATVDPPSSTGVVSIKSTGSDCHTTGTTVMMSEFSEKWTHDAVWNDVYPSSSTRVVRCRPPPMTRPGGLSSTR